MQYSYLSTFCWCFFLSQALQAQTDSTEIKKKYTLFNPVPQNEMREFSPDRPDVTESSYTVDAGHFQYEADFVRTSRELKGDITKREINIHQAYLKLGLNRTGDVQLVIRSYTIQKETGEADKQGFGDMLLRYKQNIWGNDEGKTAFALVPFVKLPTNSLGDNKSLEGGLIAPFTWTFAKDWLFGTQAEFDIMHNEESDKGYHAEISNSATLEGSVIGPLEAFVEGYYTYGFEDHVFNPYLNTGIIVAVLPNVRLDAAMNYGIKKETPRIFYVGMSLRY